MVVQLEEEAAVAEVMAGNKSKENDMNLEQKIYKALILLDKGKEAPAIQCLKECIAQGEEDMLTCARAHAILGHVYYELEQYTDAIHDLQYLIEHKEMLVQQYEDALDEEFATAQELLQEMCR